MKQQNLVENSYNLNKFLNDQIGEQYQIDVTNKFSALEGLEISSVDYTWVKIRDSIKASAKEKVRILETKINPDSTMNVQN
jgi:hypothetical protein